MNNKITKIVFDGSSCNGEENEFAELLKSKYPQADIRIETPCACQIVDGIDFENSIYENASDFLNNEWDNYC